MHLGVIGFHQFNYTKKELQVYLFGILTASFFAFFGAIYLQPLLLFI